MKFRITFKDPDGPYGCMRDIASDYARNLTKNPKEQEAIEDVKFEEIQEFTEPWISYNEYVTIEFDTEANTATVVKV